MIQGLGLSIALAEDRAGMKTLTKAHGPATNAALASGQKHYVFAGLLFADFAAWKCAGREKLSPARRSAIARKAARARWRKPALDGAGPR
jgi:hypothetical protein